MDTTTIATIKEVKDNENRVGLTPQGAAELTKFGHRVLVQTGAGLGSGFSDAEYIEAGAELMDDVETIIETTEILVKVKEPIPAEYPLLDKFKGKTLYTYLHLSGVDRNLTLNLIENGITAIAYETVEDEDGKLPLLAPMSEVAGVLAVQYGAQYLQKKYHGRGMTLGVITGTERAEVVVMGGGFVGEKSAKTAAGMGCNVTIFDINSQRIEELKTEMRAYLGDHLYQNVQVLQSSLENVNAMLPKTDLLIGAVLLPGTKAPEVISEEQVKLLPDGSVIVDVSIDQGGCIWGAKSTTHSEPIYEVHGKIFCCVANMPGQAARQSTQALTSATLPYLVKMANEKVMDSLRNDERFARGLNTYQGNVTYEAVAKDLDLVDKYQEFKV